MKNVSNMRLDRITVELVSRLEVSEVKKLNQRIFGEERIINSWEHESMAFFIARYHHEAIGFKLGYAKNEDLFYSAKGGVISAYRRKGVATKLLSAMIKWCVEHGYQKLGYDTLPDKWPGMYQLGLKEGFMIVSKTWSKQYDTRQIYLEKDIGKKWMQVQK